MECDERRLSAVNHHSQLFCKLLICVVYENVKTWYNTKAELQYVIRQHHSLWKGQNLLTSDGGLIGRKNKIKAIRHSVFCRVSFLYSFFGRRMPERRRPRGCCHSYRRCRSNSWNLGRLCYHSRSWYIHHSKKSLTITAKLLWLSNIDFSSTLIRYPSISIIWTFKISISS